MGGGPAVAERRRAASARADEGEIAAAYARRARTSEEEVWSKVNSKQE
ncbi:hypothetical protein [Streptomyces rubiginosohelvolus]